MQKIKLFIKDWVGSDQGKDILIIIIIILVGSGSFELGRLSKGNDSSSVQIGLKNQVNNGSNADILSVNNANAGKDYSKANITETSATNIISGKNSKNSSEKNFFASSKGSKYYPAGCKAGQTIKEENKIYFATGEQAQAAGYTLSSSCK